MHETEEDKYLVNEVLSGNKKAFTRLIKQYERLVLHIVTPLIGISQDREDICQDVFIQVYRKLHSFQFRSKLATWIGNIAYNASINFLKKKRNILLSDLMPDDQENSFPDSIGNDGKTAEDIMIGQEKVRYLNEAINALPEIQKSIVLLFYHDDLSLDEIGLALEMPVNTVKSHLHRARMKLKESLTIKEEL